jgi:hypothetical protein
MCESSSAEEKTFLGIANWEFGELPKTTNFDLLIFEVGGFTALDSLITRKQCKCTGTSTDNERKDFQAQRLK